ncbi:Elongation factor P [Vibrio chagasii]|nr:Elongation factor P [Vibrio chagasii]CAH7235793.1 Elongation factor P [Vibrio chagasii]CAH7435764.1 Elongation factor P [Vibrio chagasii]
MKKVACAAFFVLKKADASKRDAGCEERERQMRVNEMRDTKNNKKAELDNLALLSIFCS